MDESLSDSADERANFVGSACVCSARGQAAWGLHGASGFPEASAGASLVPAIGVLGFQHHDMVCFLQVRPDR